MIELLALNINSPSLSRAQLQIEAILSERPDVLVLTEAKFTQGCRHIVKKLQLGGYKVHGWNDNKFDGFATLIASRVEMRNLKSPTPTRDCIVELESADNLRIFGAYGPSTDPFGRSDAEKVHEKRKWLQWLVRYSTEAGGKEQPPTLMVGDLNIVDDREYGQYSAIQHFERAAYRRIVSSGFEDLLYESNQFTWENQRGQEFRFDFALANLKAKKLIASVHYDHAWRQGVGRLTDHSGVRVRLTGNYPQYESTETPTSSQLELF